MMKVAIAGGTGVIGTKLIELLQLRGDEIIVLTRQQLALGEQSQRFRWSIRDTRKTVE